METEWSEKRRGPFVFDLLGELWDKLTLEERLARHVLSIAVGTMLTIVGLQLTRSQEAIYDLFTLALFRLGKGG
jgi:hypothetical protein